MAKEIRKKWSLMLHINCPRLCGIKLVLKSNQNQVIDRKVQDMVGALVHLYNLYNKQERVIGGIKVIAVIKRM